MMLFSEKLDQLSETADLQLRADHAELRRAFEGGFGKVAYAIGSGGSAVCGEYLSTCRGTLQPAPTIVSTPMQFTLGLEDLSEAQIWIFSGRGGNQDVMAAFRAALDRHAREIVIVTSSATAVLASEAQLHPEASVIVLSAASEKDGFLATHTLLAVIVALLDVAASCAGSEPAVESFKAELDLRLSSAHREAARARFVAAGRADAILVLSDPRLAPLATMLETSLWETAMFAVEKVDFRNFAHGRHVWLSKRAQSTFVIALVSTAAGDVWRDIKKVVEGVVPIAEFEYGNAGRFENAVALVDGFTMIEALGQSVGVDPAKPGIGPFARSIYESSSLVDLAERMRPSVRQKMAACLRSDRLDARRADLIVAEAEFRSKFDAARVGAVILDYDGTIVDTSGRFDPPGAEIIAELNRLLDAGAVIALATGRGDSAGKALREVLNAKHYRDVIIGYYNGAYLRTLDIDIEANRPPRDPSIQEVMAWLEAHPELFLRTNPNPVHDSAVQLSIDAGSLRDPVFFKTAFEETFGNSRLNITRSEHSFDIVLARSCKTNVIAAVREKLRDPTDAIICIGDRGEPGGNDYRLLGSEHGISVGQVCDRTGACWSFFGRKIMGPKALLRILGAIQPVENFGLRLDVGVLR